MNASDEIHRAASATSEIIGKVTDSAIESVHIAREGSQAVQQTLTQMNDIKGAVNESASSIETLDDYSKQIGAIVETIQEIADPNQFVSFECSNRSSSCR